MCHGFPHRMVALESSASVMTGQGTKRNCFCESSKSIEPSLGTASEDAKCHSCSTSLVEAVRSLPEFRGVELEPTSQRKNVK